MWANAGALDFTSRLGIYPPADFFFGHHDAIADPQCGEPWLMHQLIGTGDGYTQDLCHHVRIEKQWQLVIVCKCRFLHLTSPLCFYFIVKAFSLSIAAQLLRPCRICVCHAECGKKRPSLFMVKSEGLAHPVFGFREYLFFLRELKRPLGAT